MTQARNAKERALPFEDFFRVARVLSWQKKELFT